MSRNIAPWWERGWKSWWDNQQTTLLIEDRRGQFQYDAARHKVRWRGRIKAMDRWWDIEIRWGPGTPFLPPWIYPLGLYSKAHQFRDRSMCLAPSSFTEVQEISGWLAQTRTWLDVYVRLGLETSVRDWLAISLQRPDPGYRLHAPPHSYLLSPVDWIPPTPYGELVATLPGPDGGLGVLRRWRAPGRHQWEKFDDGHPYKHLNGEEVQGYWSCGMSPRTSDSVDKFLYERLVWAGRRGFIAFNVRPPGGQQRWDLVHFDPAAVDETARELLSLYSGQPQAPSFGTFMSNCNAKTLIKGIPMRASELSERTKRSRSQADNGAIRNACVVLVGLGALGSEVAHLLAKEQVDSFVLVDGDLLLPGNVARHRLDLASAGGNKATQMRHYILKHHRDARVEVVPAMLDEALPGLSIPDNALFIGMTGDLPSERALSAIAQQNGWPCLHAWMECDGRVLRLLRSMPGRDPGLHEITELPALPWIPSSPPPERCADNVLPGAASNLHAAANFVARVAVDVLCGRIAVTNHTLFAPDGMEPGGGIPSALCGRYGNESCRLEKAS